MTDYGNPIYSLLSWLSSSGILGWLTPGGILGLILLYIGGCALFRVAGAIASRVLGLLFRAANNVSGKISRAIIARVDNALSNIERKMGSGTKEDAETKRLRADWKREFKGKVSWEEFQWLNDDLKRSQQQKRYEPEPPGDYGSALKLFGLKEPFSRAELDGRYKQLIVRFHPDQLRAPELTYLAAQVNAGRDVIMKARRWA